MNPGFTGATIDRADRLRGDAAALALAVADPAARLLRLNGLDPFAAPDGGLAWDGVAAAGGTPLALLGLEDGVPCFVALTDGVPPATQRSGELMALIAALPRHDVALYAAARSLVDWHARHGFCANCGHATAPIRAGWARRCAACTAEHFPRTDPVAIMLAVHDDRVLVGRQASWPERRYSALAGFVEVGESIEEAVARELLEEAGVAVRNVRYVASQPWPFPSQLMIACIADAADDTITLDTNELQHAFWATRAEVAAAMAGDPDAAFLAPPPYAIAHTLFARWLAGA